MPFLHHRPDYRAPSDEEDDCGDDDSFSPSTTATGGRPKFRNPRKRASKLFHQLQTEAETESRLSKPEVWTVPFKVGDAIELGILDDGGAANPNNKKLDHVRGVVLGRENKGLDTSIYLKDVLYGEFSCESLQGVEERQM
jgi:ribosomal protein L19